MMTSFRWTVVRWSGGPVVRWSGGPVVPGSLRTANPMPLLGHLDVLNARREDWERDPFKFIEEGGYF